MTKAGKLSIRKEIFNSSLIFSLIILVVFSLFLTNILYNLGMSKAHDIIKQRNYAINFFIEGYFSEINNTINILAANKEIQDAPWLDSSARQRVLDLYKSFSEANLNITYIYSGYKNGKLLINNYLPPEGYDATVRPWYQAAMAAKPEISAGEPYQDINDKELLFATGKALFSNNNGYCGVVSIDSSIEIISDLLKQRGDVYKSSYSFAAKPDGEVILHHNASYLKRFMSEILGRPVSLNKTEGRLTYRLGDVEKIAYYSRNNESGWVIVTVVEKNEITKPIIWKIFFSIMLIGLIAVLFWATQSSLLSRRFSNPLIELQKRVNAIICGNRNNDSDYIYPNNEIGIIAKEVGQLAEHELYVKSQELAELNAKLNLTIEEREKLIKELQEALKEIKTLRGILPLCSFCKKIRDDKGYWEQVDVYIYKYSEADISHSICPECMKIHYPMDWASIESKKNKE
jgi:cache domain-containing protein